MRTTAGSGLISSGRTAGTMRARGTNAASRPPALACSLPHTRCISGSVAEHLIMPEDEPKTHSNDAVQPSNAEFLNCSAYR